MPDAQSTAQTGEGQRSGAVQTAAAMTADIADPGPAGPGRRCRRSWPPPSGLLPTAGPRRFVLCSVRPACAPRVWTRHPPSEVLPVIAANRAVHAPTNQGPSGENSGTFVPLAQSVTVDDPLGQLAAWPGVAQTVAEARAAVDGLLNHRMLRQRSIRWLSKPST